MAFIRSCGKQAGQIIFVKRLTTAICRKGTKPPFREKGWPSTKWESWPPKEVAATLRGKASCTNYCKLVKLDDKIRR